MKSKTEKTRYCQLPSPGSIAGRSSSITNAFFNSIIPIHEPSQEEVLEALRILAIDPEDITCAYCGDRSSEWDHLRPVITNQQPTGYITEIANLVPACGKCNQSKGKRHWREWMLSSARLSPATRNITNLHARAEKLTLYAMWKPPTKIDFSAVVSAAVWEGHHTNWRHVMDLLQKSQKLAKEIRETIESAPRHCNSATGQITYGRHPEDELDDDTQNEFLEHEVVSERIQNILASKR
jgi:5-methylcytosine-specific restriction endonuclease McrA